MRVLRFDDGGTATLGVLRDEHVVSLAPLAGEYPTMLSVIAGGQAALERIGAFVAQASAGTPVADVRLLAPIERPGKYLAIGMNYRKHIEEAKRLGVAVPTHQYWFNKQTSSLAGPHDAIEPGVTEQLDYEVELGVVIGQAAKHVSREDSPAHVFGYTICDDVTARDWQKHSPTFTIGKSFDTHGPIGPWIVTADEIGDPHRLGLRCFVNGDKRQDGNTSELVFDVWDQIAYLSTAMTLDPGDLLATGTPDGVGVARTPPVFLKPGDVVRCEIDGIGAIENTVAAPH